MCDKEKATLVFNAFVKVQNEIDLIDKLNSQLWCDQQRYKSTDYEWQRLDELRLVTNAKIREGLTIQADTLSNELNCLGYDYHWGKMRRLTIF